MPDMLGCSWAAGHLWVLLGFCAQYQGKAIPFFPMEKSWTADYSEKCLFPLSEGRTKRPYLPASKASYDFFFSLGSILPTIKTNKQKTLDPHNCLSRENICGFMHLPYQFSSFKLLVPSEYNHSLNSESHFNVNFSLGFLGGLYCLSASSCLPMEKISKKRILLHVCWGFCLH